MKALYRYLNFIYWKLRGGLPNGYVKQYLLSGALKASGCQLFIETGTLNGQMVNWQARNVKQAYTIELDQAYFQRAVARFQGRNIECIHGNSGEALERLLQQVHEPCFFWLDAHFSGGDTAQADLDTPIRSELEAILRHDVQGHHIWIDDARCFDGTRDYPLLAEVEKWVGHDYTLDVSHDIIRLKPVISI